MIKEKVAKIRNNPLVRQIGTVFTGGAIGQLIVLITAPIITRLFTPEDFGIFALFLSIASMIGNNSQLAYYQAIVIPRKEETAQDLLILCIALSAIVSLASGVFFWGLYHFDANLSWVVTLNKWVLLFPLAIFIIGANLTLSSYNNRHKKYTAIATSNVVGNSLTPGIRIGLGLFCGSSVALLVLSQILALLIQSAIYLRATLLQVKTTIQRLHTFNWLANIGAFKDFPIYSFPSNLFASIGFQMPVIILAATTSPAIVGFYSLANRLVLRPLFPIQDAVRQVYQRKVAENINDNKNMQHEFLKITSILFLIGIIPFTVIGIWGKLLFGFILGVNWSSAGSIASVLSPWLFTGFILPPANAILLIGRHNRFRMYFQFVSISLRISILYFGLKSFAKPIHGIFSFSLSSALLNLLLIVIVFLFFINKRSEN